MASCSRRYSLATEPFIFFYCISLGVYFSLVPQLTVSKVCHSKYNNNTICSKLSSGNYKHEEKLVYDEATKWNSLYFALSSIPSAFSILFVGAMSDLVSKRKLLFLPPIAVTLQSILLILSAKYKTSSLMLVAFASSLTSVFGDVQGSIMLAYSYMADVTEADQNRTVRMNILEGIIFLSLGCSSFSAGMLLQKYGYVVAFSLSLSASISNFIFVALMLPECKTQDHSTSQEETMKSKWSSFLELIKKACLNINTFFKRNIISRKNKHIGLLLLAAFFTNSAILGENVILVVFLKHRPLALSPSQIGTFMLILQCMRGIGVVFLAIISLKFFKPSDPCIIIIGQISIISIFTAVGLSTKWQILYGVTPLAIAFPLALSAMRSNLTKLVEPEEHGIVLSIVALVSIIGLVIINFASNSIFRLTAVYFPGLSMLLLAIVCLAGLCTSVSIFCMNIYGSSPNRTSQEQDDIQEEEVVALLDVAKADQSFH